MVATGHTSRYLCVLIFLHWWDLSPYVIIRELKALFITFFNLLWCYMGFIICFVE